MKVKVKREFELYSNHKAYEGDIFNLITVNKDFKDDYLLVILEKFNHIFPVFFDNEFDANNHLEFNYKEIMDPIWIREDEVNKRIADVCKKKDEQIEYWKNRFSKTEFLRYMEED